MAKKDSIQDELDALLEDDDDDDDEEVSEADIRKMKKAELKEFVEEQGLDIDDIGTMKVNDLKDAVVEAYLEDDDDDDEEEDDEEEDEDEEEEEEDEEDDEEDEDEDEDDDDDDDEEEDEDDEDEDELTYEEVMGMSSKELKLVEANEGVKVKKNDRKKLKSYRLAVVAALELEPEDDEEDEDEEEEEEEEAPKRGRKASSPKNTVFGVASGYTKKKGKVTKDIPFKENTKRGHAAKVMMQSARTAEDHQKQASKTHRKAGVSHSKDYVNTIDANFIRILGGMHQAVFEVDDEDSTLKLLGFVATKDSKTVSKAKPTTAKTTKKGKKGKRSKK